jgi:hypothetical protein
MTKSKPQKKIINCTTGEEITRDFTDEEITEMELTASNEKIKQAEAEAKEAAKANLFKKLGLTADEAQLLLG